MFRSAVWDMEQWRGKEGRKPLVLTGARQVGKTWLMKEFGKQFYEKTFYFNFDEEPAYSSVFENDKKPERIIEKLGIIAGNKILPKRHLIILDEIQECPEALNSLKYFYEEAPEYHIMAAGSLLGTYLSDDYAFPVGKVNLLRVFPLTFAEFLYALDESLFDYYEALDENSEMEEIFHKRLSEYYHLYLIIGGMPECVASWIAHHDYAKVELIQEELLLLYESDITKHNKKVNAAKVLLVYRNLVTQLAKENKKFVYGVLKPGARAREYEDAIEWLVNAGLIYRIYNISKPEFPVRAYRELSDFKLYFLDVALLRKMAGVGNEKILLEESFPFLGAITENYVLQQIFSKYDVEPVYFSTSASGEIDFVIQHHDCVIPIEVKSAKPTKSTSFRNYLKKYSPEQAIKFTKLPPKKNETVFNLPLYLAGKLP